MMSHNGLTKLLEECGELSQVAAKLIAFPDDNHPDGNGSLRFRLEDEAADVMAAIGFVIHTLGLDEDRILNRAASKMDKFKEWNSHDR
jgi:NTP pyrophosphatase (non-canonical NTP hydrolase)